MKSKILLGLLIVILSALLACEGQEVRPTPTPTEPAASPVAVATPTPVEEEIPTPRGPVRTPTPEVVPEEALYLPEVPRITCEELKQLIDEGVDLLLVDTRFEDSFERGHISGAINIPYTPLPPLTEEMVTERLLMLPRDKLIVLYCD